MALDGRKVNLFIVGAPKCGTTSLYKYLSEHYEVFMSPVKEPNFFSKANSIHKHLYELPKKNKKYSVRIINDLEIYNSLFENLQNEKIIGEASTSYLWDEHTAYKIHKYNSDAKIIVLLKEPVDRAYSQYLMNFYGGTEKEINFVQAAINDYDLKETETDKTQNYIKQGQYFDQINRYDQYFSENKILIINSNDFLSDTQSTLKLVATFLKIDAESFHKIDLKKYNEIWIPKSQLIRFFFKLCNKFFLSDYLNNILNNRHKIFFKRIFFERKKDDNVLTDLERSQLNFFFEESNNNLFRDYKIKF